MGSHLSVYDLAGRTARTVLSTERLIEAPNWTADGRRLIVNGDGLLWSVDLEQPDLVHIPTPGLTKLNNDHGLSPDNALIALSDGTADGKSAVYVMPLDGGTPVRVTPEVPSYWHGWSPDGRTLAYVAKRGEAPFDIRTRPVDGGPETVLTRDFEHTDGPDYTPEGEWIWFNGQRGGRMTLWRMHPDGSGLERMTDDECWNWFPHPSPDGRWVLYLAYEAGTTGHPRDREVQLRLLPAAGGAPEVLLEVFGGQGTINVPCWAPDGSAFAFVHYDRPEG